MRVKIIAVLLTGLYASFTAAANDETNCEAVLMERIAQQDREGTAEIASFRPADDFIASVYDDEAETLRQIDELPIRAIMCERKSIVPTLRDFPILATGIPLMISQNFDSASSGLTTVFFKDGEFQYNYKGPELDAAIGDEIKDRLSIYNLQPHDLAEKEKAMMTKAKARAQKSDIK